MIIQKDRDMYDFVQKYGCITPKQAHLMFYPNTKYGYESARKRLVKLAELNRLKYYDDKKNKLKIFYEKNKYSYHRVLLLDYLSRLINLGCNIIFFQPEFEWMDGKIRSDAFTGYIYNGNMYFNFVEVITSNNKPNLEKYDKLYDSKELEKFCQDKFPLVVLIDNTKRRKEIKLNNANVIQLDYSLKDIAKIMID